MTTPPIIPTLSKPPSITTSASSFAEDADAFLSGLPEFGAKANELGTYMGQRASEAQAAKSAAESARDNAADRANAASQSAATANQQRLAAEVAAAAARASAGMPSIENKPRHKLAVNASGNSVEWVESKAVVETFSDSGTFNRQDDDLFYLVELWGGGGSGASSTGSTTYTGGGSGGQYRRLLIPAEAVPATVAVSVGDGGAGNDIDTSANGSAGGDTTFGEILRALGGNPGLTGQYATAPGATLPSAPSSAHIKYMPHKDAGYGSYGGDAGGDTENGGGGGGGARGTMSEHPGGVSQNGGNGGAGSRILRGQAEDGETPGGGGGGGSNRSASGKGGKGLAVITRFKV